MPPKVHPVPPTGRLNAKTREFSQIVYDMRHVVFSVIRERQMPNGMRGCKAIGTGFFVARNVFVTCDHVMNHPNDPHQSGDSYLLVANLTGTSGKLYSLRNPQIGTEINLFPNLDLAVLRVASAAADQPFAALEYGDVYPGEDIGVVGYPLPNLQVINGNMALNSLLYRAARGCVTGRYFANDGALLNVPIIEVNFLFVPGNSGGPVFSAETGRVMGFVRGFQALKIRESIATVSMIQNQQLPLGLGNQYIENLNAIYSLAVKLDFIRTTIEGFGATL
ncbi:MAG: serine protease [Negativicutes bacterium]|nr:serine protease [Negativicutes bacterium]